MKKAFPFFVCFLLVCAVIPFRQISSKVESASQIEQPVDLSNYDIRTDQNAAARASLIKFRGQADLDSSLLEARKKRMSDGEAELRRRVSALKIESGERLRIPEVISIDVARNIGEWLTAPGDAKRANILRSFIKQNSALFGLDERQINALKTTADYTNPDGNLSFAHLEQEINGLRVFQGEVKAGFTRRGEIVRVINNLAPLLDYQTLSAEAEISAERAVGEAAKSIGVQIDERDTKRLDTAANDKKVRFERGRFADETTVEKIYFPAEIDAARLAWRILLWQKSDAFDVIIDALDGTLLWRKNIAAYQTQTANYNVYGRIFSGTTIADSPTPGTPGCINPNDCPQPPIINRATFQLIGNEPPYTFNNLGWIPDGENRTIGNNAEAGIDRDGVNGVDPQGYAFGIPPRNFVYNYNPAPGNPPPGEEPLPPQPQTYPPTAFQQGSVTNAFYVTNRFHDEMYRFGFTEAARNFQTDNFGRGGVGGDSISVEVQDSSGTNNANFAAPGDGGRGRLQLYVWTGTVPARDGALDNQLIVHELTHGVSSRLHGNGTGLGGTMAAGMGEGWSDFYALAMLSEVNDSPAGTYPYGSYSIFGITPGAADYYYGSRRFPTASIGVRGPNGFPHNPLTFAHLNQGNCATFNSAYPPRFNNAANCGQVAFIGEVWSAALWEIRFRFTQRLGDAVGNRKILQLVTDGMKLAPLNPTMLQERDALIIAAQASSLSPETEIDAAEVWRGFARRGMGFGASIITASPLNVVQSFALPPQFLRPNRADFDGDGKTDVSVYRPNDGVWYVNRSSQGFTGVQWGISTDLLAPGDYNGDGRADYAVFRPTAENGVADFYVLRSSDFTMATASWGIPGDLPFVGDYDGDDKDDFAVYRSSDRVYYVLQSSNGNVLISRIMPNLRPVTGDFDGDGKTDFGSFGNGQWFISLSGSNHQSGITTAWGLVTDKLVPADYDGDGIDNLAVYRPSDGTWYIRMHFGGYTAIQFGIDTDIPAPGDYDGDGRADVAVYRDGVWYLNQSTAGFAATQFGVSGDAPIPNRYLP